MAAIIPQESRPEARNIAEVQDVDAILVKLRRSRFRARFHLHQAETTYLQEKGFIAVEQHAREFIAGRLAPAHPLRDGKQTPFKGHPVFIAQHATATCCRSCLQKWHGLAKGIELTSAQQQYIIAVIMAWLHQVAAEPTETPRVPNLFDEL